MWKRIKAFWRTCQDKAHTHQEAVKRTHHVSHLAYFAMVTTHGPYHLAAFVLLVIGIVAWALHLDEL